MEIMNFVDMQLDERTMKAISEMGFIEPSPIQRMAIPKMQEGLDLIAQAQTGTGKTAAFGIPIIEKLDFKKRKVQAVVLTPTRELAIQVAGEMNKLAKYHSDISVIPIYGGQSIDRQIRALKSGVHMVIGTPGRMLDHIRRKTIDLSEAKFVVLDEADEMLDMGFLEDIESILTNIGTEERQMVLFSATMPSEIMDISKRFLKNPEVIKIVHKELTVPQITQYFYEIRESEKAELLTRLIDYYNPKLAMVFVKTKVGVEELKERVHAAGYSVEGLHGDMKQTQRDFVMKRFRNCDFDILIATDVAARGLDVDDIDMVFNYDLPQDEEYYVHRIGRTARAGREGVAVSFVTLKEMRKLKDIERYIKTRIEKKSVPTLKDVENMRNQALVTSIKDIIEEGGLDKYVTAISDTLSDYLSIEVAAALMKMITDKKQQENPKGEIGYADESEYIRFFLTIGKRDGVSTRDLVDWVIKTTGISGRNIEQVTLLEKFSFVNVPSVMASQFVDSIAHAKFKGRRVNTEYANKK